MKLAVALLLPALAAAQNTAYAQLQYFKIKPGPAEKERAYRDAMDKIWASQMSEGPIAGHIRLIRVFPTRPDIDHDGLVASLRTTPPDFAPAPDSFYRAAGVTREQQGQMRDAVRQIVRTEIWTNVFRHGALQKGDFVQLRFVDPPLGKSGDYLAMTREYWGAMRQDLVKKGSVKGDELWRLWGTEEEAPYNFVHLIGYPDPSGLFKSWGDRATAFKAVHPGKDYADFDKKYDASSNVSKYIVYRVDAAMWK